MRTVTATADGRARAVPDLLTALVGVSNVGTEPGAVMAENGERAAALLDRLVALGVDGSDFSTTSVSLHQEHDREGRPAGYRATNILSVRLRELARAGDQLDELLRAGGGAARLDDVSLGFSDEDTLLSQARTDGVRRALAQAREMAEAAGSSVGQVVSITDDVLDGPSPRGLGAEAMSVRKAVVPIAAGTRELVVRVRVVAELA